ncbi:hypothetical protein T265_05318 [Opisthorchis viverrini]|uniref:Uncharacterized protein n=1 Tax=Opisthorchis viverrini TaxID=6198 RepID=A0A074ZPG9_OPIVI|nr:hypothetical protein T265_05318 [Opisthorchis viverrini]KER27687.1 hypothetical protein T265_05318 [Opisthorchis viverrini]
MTSVFNTDASLPYNHDLFESLIVKKRVKVDGASLPQSFRVSRTETSSGVRLRNRNLDQRGCPAPEATFVRSFITHAEPSFAEGSTIFRALFRVAEAKRLPTLTRRRGMIGTMKSLRVADGGNQVIHIARGCRHSSIWLLIYVNGALVTGFYRDCLNAMYCSCQIIVCLRDCCFPRLMRSAEAERWPAFHLAERYETNYAKSGCCRSDSPWRVGTA